MVQTVKLYRQVRDTEVQDQMARLEYTKPYALCSNRVHTSHMYCLQYISAHVSL